MNPMRDRHGDNPMQTAPASACRLGDWRIGIGDPFIIASREHLQCRTDAHR